MFAAAITAESAGTAGNTPAAHEAVERLTFSAMSRKKSPNYGNEKITWLPNDADPD